MKKITLGLFILMGAISFANETIESSEKENTNITWEYPCYELWKLDMATLQEDFGATFKEALVLADRNFYSCLEEEYGN